MSKQDPRPLEGDIEEAASTALVAAQGNSLGGDLDSGLAIELSKAEIDLQIATAHAYPRSNARAIRNIIELATQDTAAATECIYALPRDGKAITGPSIRLAELIFQQWGNNRVASRIVAVDRKEGFVEAEAIYHDLETNSASGDRVRRSIKGKSGKIFSPDMIIVTGNAARSIAKRNAILSGVPRPIWRMAYEKAQAAVRGDEKTLGARRVALLTAFNDLGIKPATVFQLARVGGEVDIGLDQFVVLSGLFTALRNGEATVEDLLATTGGVPAGKTLSAAFGDKPKAPAQTQAPKAEPEPVAEVIDQDTGEVMEPEADAEPEKVEAPMTEVAMSTEPAGPGETYFHASDAWDRLGLRPVYRDGEKIGEGGAKSGNIIRLSHAPKIVAKPAEPEPEQAQISSGEERTEPVQDVAETVEAPAGPEPVTEPEDFDPAPFNEYAAKVQAADSWLVIKAARISFRKTDAYKAASPEMQAKVHDIALDATKALIAAGKDPVRETNDPFYFGLWLTRAPAHEIRPAFTQLLRSPAYAAMTDAGKDGLAGEVSRAIGEG
jgi:hypothetical protein